jgi:hypothetical protein
VLYENVPSIVNTGRDAALDPMLDAADRKVGGIEVSLSCVAF